MSGENKLLMHETLDSAREYHIKLINGIESCVADIENGQIDQAMAIIPLIIEGLSWLLKAMQLTSSIQKFTIDLNDLNQNLIEVNEALENRDFIMLADILRYEIITRLQEWNTRNFNSNSSQLS